MADHNVSVRSASAAYPIRRVRDSAGLGWGSVAAGVYREDAVAEPFETEAFPELLVVVVTSGTYRIESEKAGRWAGTTYRPGSVGVTAPMSSSVLRWSALGPAPMESVQVRLAPRLVEETKQELPRSVTRLPDALTLDDPFVAATGAALGTALRYRAPALYADSLAQALAVHLLTTSTPAEVPRPSRGLDPRALRRVVTHIHEHPADDLSLEDLATVANYSVFHFLRLFSESTGMTPHRYVVDVRMRRAAELLKRLDRPVAVVAAECGYRSVAQFTATFRRHFGCSPRAYRRIEFGSTENRLG